MKRANVQPTTGGVVCPNAKQLRNYEMSNFGICTRPTIGVFSFTTGFTASPQRMPRTETDILAKALWLERNGKEDEALQLLDRYCASKR